MDYKQKCKQLFIIVCLFSVLLIGCSLLIVFIYDPLQLTKSNYYDEKKFMQHHDMRLQARGIITNVDFDSIILGSSVLHTASAKQASKLLGGSFVNISQSGLNFYERAFILEYLFKHKKIKNILYSFEFYEDGFPLYTHQHDNWELLYDNNWLNDIRVLFSATYIRPTIDYITSIFNKTYEPNKVGVEFFDKPNFVIPENWKYHDWMNNNEVKNTFDGIQMWIDTPFSGSRHFFKYRVAKAVKALEITKPVRYESVNIENQKEYIATYILRFVMEYPDTNFHLILNPYYRYNFAEWRQLGGQHYFTHQKIIRFLVEKSKQYKNLFIYGFEDQAFVDQIRSHVNFNHHAHDINDFMISSIAKGMNRITSENVDEYLAVSEKLALEFDMVKFHKLAQEILRKETQIKSAAD